MKNISKIIILISLILTSLLTSCEKKTEFDTPANALPFSVYQDRVYFIDESSAIPMIKYSSIEDGECINICYDPTCRHDTYDCPVIIPELLSIVKIVIDPNIIDRAVVYSLCLTSTDGQMKYCIYRYDSANGEKDMLLENWDNGRISYMALWGNYIYFFAYPDGECAVYRIPAEGGQPEKVFNAGEGEAYYLFDVEKEEMYLYDFDRYLYRANMDFSEIEKLEFSKLPEKGFSGFVKMDGEYLYYMLKGEEIILDVEYPIYNNQTKENEYTTSYTTYNMYRLKKNDLDCEPEFVAENCDKTPLGSYIFDNTLFAPYQGHVYVGTKYDIDPISGKAIPQNYVSYYPGIKAVNLETMEETTVFGDSTYEVYSICSVSDKYIIFRGSDIKSGYETQLERGFFVYDRAEKTFTRLK